MLHLTLDPLFARKSSLSSRLAFVASPVLVASLLTAGAGCAVEVEDDDQLVPASAHPLTPQEEIPESEDEDEGEASEDDAQHCLGRTLPAMETDSYRHLGQLGEQDVFIGRCNEESGPESVFVWTAPYFGVYTFTVVSADFVPAVSLLNGTSCEADEFYCRTSTPDAKASTSFGRIELQEGQVAAIIVDSSAGDSSGTFALEIRFEGEPWD